MQIYAHATANLLHRDKLFINIVILYNCVISQYMQSNTQSNMEFKLRDNGDTKTYVTKYGR